MNIITAIIDKILFITYFISIFVVGRQAFLFIRFVNKSDGNQKYVISKHELFYLAVTLSVIITGVIKGIGI